jgi:hypothetical protein
MVSGPYLRAIARAVYEPYTVEAASASRLTGGMTCSS